MPKLKRDTALPDNISDGKLRLGFDGGFLSLWDYDYQATFFLDLTAEQRAIIRREFTKHNDEAGIE